MAYTAKDQKNRSVSASRWVALLLVLLAFALRVYHLDLQSLWSDEGISILRSSQPLGQMLRNMPVEHVPGYFLLLHFWFPLAGTGDFALRFPSLIPSVLTVAIAFRLGADLGSRRAGLAAALLLATNAFQVWYGQEARMYGWLLATGLGSTWFLWRLLVTGQSSYEERSLAPCGRPDGHKALGYNRQISPDGLLDSRPPADGAAGKRGISGFFGSPARRIAFAGYVLCTAATVYLHHYGFLVPISQVAFMLVWLAFNRDLPGFGRWVVAGCGVVLLYVPWLPRFLGIFGFPGWRRPLDPRQLPWRYLAAYTAGDPMPGPWHNWLPWAYLALALLGLYFWWRRNRAAAFLLFFTTALPLAGALALALRKPDYHERYTIFITGPLMLLAALGIAGLAPNPGGAAAKPAGRPRRAAQGRAVAQTVLAGLVLFGLVAANGLALQRLYTDPSAQKADYKTPIQRLEQVGMPGDIVLLDGPDPDQIFLHYYQGSLPWQDLRALQGAPDAEVDRVLTEATQGARRAWLLRHYYDEGPVEVWLARHGWLASQTYYGGLFFSVYGLPALPQARQAANVSFGAKLRLTQVSLAGAAAAENGLSVRAGDLFGVTTDWQVLQPLPPLKFSLRLIDAAGYVWQAADYVPGGGFTPTEGWPPGAPASDRHALWLPADLPPGRYSLVLVVYDPAGGAALPVNGGDAQNAVLQPITVLPAARPADPASLAIPMRVSAPYSPDLALLGVAVEPLPLQMGHSATLTVWWQALKQPAPASQVLVELAGASGQFAARKLYPLADNDSTPWQPGQIVRQRYTLELNPAAPGGSYRIHLTPAGSNGQTLGPAVSAGDVRFEARPRTYRLPSIDHPLETRLGDATALRGYDVTVPTGGDPALSLTRYWQATQQVMASYKVFVHLIDGSGRVVAQDDVFPAGGQTPSETWLTGEVVVDGHTLGRPAPGGYRLAVGLYDPAGGQRLPARDAGNQALAEDAVPLGSIEVP